MTESPECTGVIAWRGDVLHYQARWDEFKNGWYVFGAVWKCKPIGVTTDIKAAVLADIQRQEEKEK